MYVVEEMKGGEVIFRADFEDAAGIAAHFSRSAEEIGQLCEWAEEAPGVPQGLATGPNSSLIITAEEP